MSTLMVAGAGAVAGLAANGTGYLVTGRLLHGYQSRTPGTWRPHESWVQYQYAAVARLGAGIGIALLVAALLPAGTSPGGASWLDGVACALALWAATVLPVVLEAALFVNWHPGFVAGLLLDWLVAFALAGLAAALAVGIT